MTTDRGPLVKDGERIDEIGFGGLKLIQKPEEFCYGVDAVILADFAAKHGQISGELAVDLGSGTGIIPFILSQKTEWKQLLGVEVQEASCERAVRSAELNGLQRRITFLREDVHDREEWIEPYRGKADAVTCNPPYTESKKGVVSGNTPKMIARHETTANLEEFFQCASQLLRSRGEFFLVHRPKRMVDIFYYGRKWGLEPKEMEFVAPKKGEEPNILLVHMVKNGGRELELLPTLYVYDEDGDYTGNLRAAYGK